MNPSLKKKKTFLKVHVIAISVALVVSAVCVAVALATQNADNSVDMIMFGIAAVFLGLAVLAFFLYFKRIRSEWYEEYLTDIRVEFFKSYKSTTALNNYSFGFEKPQERTAYIEYFKHALEHYEHDACLGGHIFYTLGDNVFNKTKSSIDAFYVVSDSKKSTFNLYNEKQNIRTYIEEVEDFIIKKYPDNTFVNCAIVFMHESLNENQIDFYYNFAGKVDTVTESGTITQNRFYNYMGIDFSTSQAYFYLPLQSDSGNEADLEYLVVKELALTNSNSTEQVKAVDNKKQPHSQEIQEESPQEESSIAKKSQQKEIFQEEPIQNEAE